MTNKRLTMVRPTARFEETGVPGMRILRADDDEIIGELLFEAYRGTVDDEGETREDARLEAQGTLDGRYGTVLWPCCFVVVREGRALSASIVTRPEPDQAPLLAFSFSHPAYQRRGLAASLIKSSLNALHQAGHHELRLVVTAANEPALQLYRKIGFV